MRTLDAAARRCACVIVVIRVIAFGLRRRLADRRLAGAAIACRRVVCALLGRRYLLEQIVQHGFVESGEFKVEVAEVQTLDFLDQFVVVPCGFLVGLVVRDAVFLVLLLGQVAHQHRHSFEAKLFRSLKAGVADHDHAFLVHHDGLVEAVLADAGCNVLDGLFVAPRIVHVGEDGVQLAHLDLRVLAHDDTSLKLKKGLRFAEAPASSCDDAGEVL